MLSITWLNEELSMKISFYLEIFHVIPRMLSTIRRKIAFVDFNNRNEINEYICGNP